MRWARSIALRIRECDNLREARAIQQQIESEREGFSSGDLILASNFLIQIYARCGSVADSRFVFHSAAHRNVFTWNIAIAAHIRGDCLGMAWDLFDRMPQRDAVAWTSLLAAYAQRGFLDLAEKLFESMPQRDLYCCNVMIKAYSIGSDPQSVKKFFDRMPQYDIVSWNTLLAANAANGNLQDSLAVFSHMPARTVLSWHSLIGAFAREGDILCAEVAFRAIPQRHVVSWTLLISAYGRAELVIQAKAIFGQMAQRDCVTWNAMIQAYSRNGHLDDARRMLDSAPLYGQVSYNLVAAAAAQDSLEAVVALFLSMCWKDTVAWNILIQAYACNGYMESAAWIFDRMPQHDPATWTCMITGYGNVMDLYGARTIFGALERMGDIFVVCYNAMISANSKSGEAQEAFKLLARMDVRGVKPNDVTWIVALDACKNHSYLRSLIVLELRSMDSPPKLAVENAILNACESSGNMTQAEETFRKMRKRDHISWNTMLAASLQLNLVDSARFWFEKMPQHDLVSYNTFLPHNDFSKLLENSQEMNIISWNSILAAIAHNGFLLVQWLAKMDIEGTKPNAATFVTIVDNLSCADDPVTKFIHEEIVTNEQCRSSVAVLTSLISMYARLGDVAESKKLFDSLEHKHSSAAVWNSMISAYARNGYCDEAISLHRTMEFEGIETGTATMCALISACSHCGYIDHALSYFKSIGRSINAEEWTCVVDLFCRNGELSSGIDVITTVSGIPFELGSFSCTSVLSALLKFDHCV